CSCLKKLALLKVAPSLRRGPCLSSLAFFDKGRACRKRRQYGVARTFTSVLRLAGPLGTIFNEK
ncbi:MAG: hypothetical protein NXI08_17285, partial [bacterium]|nr:hypothetical protein [bacterium]